MLRGRNTCHTGVSLAHLLFQVGLEYRYYSGKIITLIAVDKSVPCVHLTVSGSENVCDEAGPENAGHRGRDRTKATI
jgi:hypothetical protein